MGGGVVTPPVSAGPGRRSPGRFAVDRARDAAAFHLPGELALAPGHPEAEAVAAQLHVLERDLLAVELRAARDARELLLELQRRALAAHRRRHRRLPAALDLGGHDVHVDQR